jgi:hypothetical protein
MICEGWEGLTVDGRFPLLEWLGGWADRCVFLTVRQSTHTANIKLIQVSGADADACVAKWEAAKALSHPCLVEMMETGRYRVNDTDVAYVVTEKADTFLSGIVPRKALTPTELAEIFVPVVDALAFVHEKDFVHGSVKPSSIALVDAEWKLSSDEMSRAGDALRLNRDLDTYDAPEVGSGTVTAAADMWSLGMIVVEACSQRTPVWDRHTAGDLGVPDWLPQPFQEIARGCVRWDPAKRISIGEVKDLLARTPLPAKSISAAVIREPERHRTAVGAAVATEPAVSTLSERVAAVRAEEPGELRPAARSLFEPTTDELVPRTRLFADISDEKESESHTGAVLFAILVLLVIGVVLGVRYRDRILPLIAKRNAPASIQPTPQAEAPENPAGAAKPDQHPVPVPSQNVPAENQTAGSQPAQPSQPVTPPDDVAKRPAQTATNEQKTPDLQAETKPKTEPKPDRAEPKETTPTPRVMNAKGAVLKRVMPDVAPGAVQSMRRPVQVDVRVSVDSKGTVSSTQCVTQSRGNYWAKISQQAAEDWKFKAPISEGQARASYWMLLFQYNRGKTDVVARQLH